jgi:hypothetical protein
MKMQMKPLPKLILALVGLSAAFWVLYVGTPKAISAIDGLQPATFAHSPNYSNGNDTVLRDGDWNIAETQRRVVLNDDLTGYAPLDKALRFAWDHVGALLLIFGLLAAISIAGANSEVTITHTDGVHPHSENMHWAGGYHDGEVQSRKRLRVGYVTTSD